MKGKGEKLVILQAADCIVTLILLTDFFRTYNSSMKKKDF